MYWLNARAMNYKIAQHIDKNDCIMAGAMSDLSHRRKSQTEWGGGQYVKIGVSKV